ncbi:MAG: flagellar motor protein MotD [Pseudomonadota bacterium]
MRRKKKPEEHENHDRWLVSYADFITLLFAFFVVMYAISSLNEGKYRVLSDSLVTAFKNAPSSAMPAHLDQPPQPTSRPITAAKKLGVEVDPKLKKQTEDMRQVAQDLLKVLAPLVKDNQVKITQSLRGVTLEINASVLFAPGQAILQAESAKALAAVAQVLAPVPNRIQIEGHTDDAPISTVYYPSNWELSSARASSVVRLFDLNGVNAERMVAIGYADNRPVVPNTDNESRARNRRVTVLIISELQDKLKEIPVAGVPTEPPPPPQVQ